MTTFLFFSDAVEAAKFDNRYYVLMRDRNIQWQQVDVSGQTGATSPRWQWNGFRGNTQVSSDHWYVNVPRTISV